MCKTVGFISLADPFKDKNAWSGTIYKLREAIEMAGFRVIWIPFRKNALSVLIAKSLRKIEIALRSTKILGDVYYKPIAWSYSKTIDKKAVSLCDYIFIPQNAPLALFIKTKGGLIYLSDATIKQFDGYYWRALPPKSLKRATRLEEEGLQRFDIIIMSSQWAIDSVINDYYCIPEKCHLLEFGYNLNTKDIVPSKPYCGGTLNILFSGVDWIRKNGKCAIDTVKELRNMGLNALLLVAGPKECPKEVEECEFVVYTGFLDKSNVQDYEKYITLYKQSHVFILPTKAECAGTVLCEATAFGIPCYTYNTGGLQNYVINDYNGYAFPTSCTAKDFAHKIYDDYVNDKFQIYHTNSLKLSKQKLSWEVWALKFSNLLMENTKEMF